MAVELNHTIIWAKDKLASARFLADILGVKAGPQWARFVPVRVGGVTLDFAADAIDEIASLAEEINTSVENIGARRLHTVLERLLEEVSFTASDKPPGTTVAIDRAYVLVNGQIAFAGDAVILERDQELQARLLGVVQAEGARARGAA